MSSSELTASASKKEDFVRPEAIKFYNSGEHRRVIDRLSLGKTRTRDKYRIVYNDRQRYELENEYNKTKYISIPRKAALSSSLALSERQVRVRDTFDRLTIALNIFRSRSGFKIVVRRSENSARNDKRRVPGP